MLSFETREEKQTELATIFDFEYEELLTAGLNLIKQGEVDSAILFFQELSLSSPLSSLSCFYLGNLHSIRDEMELAIAYYSLAWETNKNPELRHCLQYKVLFSLITMDRPDKEILKLWLTRTENCLNQYSCDELLIIDFARKILEGYNVSSTSRNN